MKRKVVVDHDILGWANTNISRLSKDFADVVKVDGSESGLAQRITDPELVAYCIRNGCELLTGDRTVYENYFGAGVKTVCITRYDWIAGKTDKPVYLLQPIIRPDLKLEET